MEVISVELTEGIVNYVQRKVILAVLLTGFMENHCCSSFHLAYARCKKGVGRQHTTLTLCQNAFCFIEFFSIVVRLCSGGYYLLTEQVCIIFATCFTLRGLDVLTQDCSLSNDFLNSSLFF